VATAAPDELAQDAGAYRTAAGITYLVTRSDLLVNTSDASVRSIAVIGPGSLSVGPSFGLNSPPAGSISFNGHATAGRHPAGLLLTLTAGGSIAATRLPTVEEDVRISSGDVQLAATVTRPAVSSRLPAIVIVHGSGRETRSILDLWTQLYVSLGFAVVTYDKRGVGDSSGRFPGEVATEPTLRLLAQDAAAVFAYVRSRVDVDPARTGLYGGSQGGWVLPLADVQVHPSFNVIASGPPLTTGQHDVWSMLTGNGAQVPSESDTAIDAALAADHSGYDPKPVLAADTTPTLWLFGAADLHVPTRLAVANLEALHRPNFVWQVIPRCGHSLLDTGTGLDSDDAAATAFGTGVFSAIGGFLQQHGIPPG
jgi:pimeloyl-ACP methyl ester carboxylesterase